MKSTPAERAEMRALREAGVPLDQIARRFGKTLKLTMNLVAPNYDKWRAKQRDKQRADRAQEKNMARGFTARLSDRPSMADYAARLAEIPPDTRTLDEILTGCPLHGRRAIDKDRRQ